MVVPCRYGWVGHDGTTFQSVNRERQLGLLLVHTTSAELQGKGYRMFIFFIQIYKTSLLTKLQDRDLGEENNPLENTLFLKAFEEKKLGCGGMFGNRQIMLKQSKLKSHRS